MIKSVSDFGKDKHVPEGKPWGVMRAMLFSETYLSEFTVLPGSHLTSHSTRAREASLLWFLPVLGARRVNSSVSRPWRRQCQNLTMAS